MKPVHGDSDLRSIEEGIGWTFVDRSLLSRALTHSSFANEQATPTPDNERLEFLGDAFIQTVLARDLWSADEGHDPGGLTFLRAALSHAAYQQTLARTLGLESHLRLGGSLAKPTKRMLGDAFEAVVGAMVADCESDPAREADVGRWVLALFRDNRPKPWPGLYVKVLNEWFQAGHGTGIPWGLEQSSGPQNGLTWAVELMLRDGLYFEGMGSSKAEARGDAARQALESLKAKS